MDIGDLVVLKSGGPIMTVSYVPTNQPGAIVHCIWFSKNNEKQKDTFRMELLKPVEKMVCNTCGAQFEPLEITEPIARRFLGSKPPGFTRAQALRRTESIQRNLNRSR